jgi:hypothetical protein
MKRANELPRNVPALRPLADDELSAVSGAGAPSVSEIVVTKSSDVSSTPLLVAEKPASSLSLRCCSGQHIKEAVLIS